MEAPEDVAGLQVENEKRITYVTQTTLSVDDTSKVIEALKARFPHIVGPVKDDICYATQNRQDAIKRLADEVDVVIVVGSPNSSNSNRLREVAEVRGDRAYMVDGPQDLEQHWFENVSAVGVTAGASAPEVLVQQVIEQLRLWGATEVEVQQGNAETIHFAIPRPLRETV